MARYSILMILSLVVMSQSTVRGSMSASPEQNNNQAMQQQRQQQVNVADEGGISMLDGGGHGGFRSSEELLPSSEQQLGQQSKALAIEREDDHSNIDLDKLIDATNRYITISDLLRQQQQQQQQPSSRFVTANEPSKYGSLIRVFYPKIMDANNKKRITRGLPQKEDKDYSFVGSAGPALMNTRYNYPAPQTYQAVGGAGGGAAGKWPSYELRDTKLAPISRFQALLALNNRHLNELSQVNNFGPYGAPVNGISQESVDSNNIDADDLRVIPSINSREKRRRCKMDPNLGVKNPSLCDTDAYFGAADYSMRDVWDSAGRRR